MRGERVDHCGSPSSPTKKLPTCLVHRFAEITAAAAYGGACGLSGNGFENSILGFNRQPAFRGWSRRSFSYLLRSGWFARGGLSMRIAKFTVRTLLAIGVALVPSA